MYWMPVSFMSSCFRDSYSSYSRGYSEIRRPKYRQPFSVRSIESKNSRSFVMPFIMSKLLDSRRMAPSLKFGLLEMFRSSDLILVSDSKCLEKLPAPFSLS